MKKMIVLTSLWSFLFIFSFSMFGCSEDDDEFGTTAERGNEVRTPRVEEINGKAVVTWIDPYITDIKEVQVKDLQTNEQQTVAKGVQSAEFAITDNSLLSYRYESCQNDRRGVCRSDCPSGEELGAKAASFDGLS